MESALTQIAMGEDGEVWFLLLLDVLDVLFYHNIFLIFFFFLLLTLDRNTSVRESTSRPSGPSTDFDPPPNPNCNTNYSTGPMDFC